MQSTCAHGEVCRIFSCNKIRDLWLITNALVEPPTSQVQALNLGSSRFDFAFGTWNPLTRHNNIHICKTCKSKNANMHSHCPRPPSSPGSGNLPSFVVADSVAAPCTQYSLLASFCCKTLCTRVLFSEVLL